ncbi:MAG: DUF305 domain-containing protein [Actinomycetota bacterium]
MKPARRASGRTGVVLLALVVAAIAGYVVRGLAVTPNPSDTSPEAGFARDMIIRHAQAVEMAEIVRSRTKDRLIRSLATDIVLTHQSQIGRLAGWLDIWGLPATWIEEPITWMGHPITGRMPGMATEAQVRALGTLPVDRMDVRFLQWMIPHHQAAVLMADDIATRTTRPEIANLAAGMSNSQLAEVDYMRALLLQRGAPETEPPVSMPGSAT